jgi:hypothetical protein
VSARAGFHCNEATWLSREEAQDLFTPQLFAEYRRTGGIRPMGLDDILGQIQADRANLRHGRSPLALKLHHRQIQPALPRSDIGNVCDSNRAGRIDRERALQMIGRNDGRATSNRARRLIAANGLDLVFAHEALNTMKTAAFASFSQIAEHPPCAVDPLAGQV